MRTWAPPLSEGAVGCGRREAPWTNWVCVQLVPGLGARRLGQRLQLQSLHVGFVVTKWGQSSCLPPVMRWEEYPTVFSQLHFPSISLSLCLKQGVASSLISSAVFSFNIDTNMMRQLNRFHRTQAITIFSGHPLRLWNGKAVPTPLAEPRALWGCTWEVKWFIKKLVL